MSETRYLSYKIEATGSKMIPEGPTPKDEQIVDEYFGYLKRLTEDGARQMLLNDLQVKQRIMRAELYPYCIAITGKLGAL